MLYPNLNSFCHNNKSVNAHLWHDQFGVIGYIGVTWVKKVNNRGGRKRLPKFKFSAKFPIGLHVILQIQIKEFENDCYIMWKIILTENPLRCNLAPLLK